MLHRRRPLCPPPLMIDRPVWVVKGGGSAIELLHLHSSPNQVLRVGVIGVGRIGRVHIESIQSIKDATVTMVRQHNLCVDRPPQPSIQPCPISLSMLYKPQHRWRTFGRRAHGR